MMDKISLFCTERLSKCIPSKGKKIAYFIHQNILYPSFQALLNSHKSEPGYLEQGKSYI